MFDIPRPGKLAAARVASCSRRRTGRSLHFEPLEDRALMAVLTDMPIVGGVGNTEAKVWVRTDLQAQAKVEYSVNADLTASALSVTERTLSGNDFAGIIGLTDLKPLTKYYYRIVIDGVPTQTENFASFTTFASPNSLREFTFAVTADLESGKADPTIAAPVYAQIAADNPNFFMQIGDFDHRNPGKLSKMREMHREVRGSLMASGVDFAQNISDEFPIFHVWDDHDYGPNNGDKLFPNKGDALRGFKEYFPTPTLANPDAGIWHSFSYTVADFFMLDLRSQRDPFLDPDGPDKSMLDGDNILNGQKDWLKAGLLNSDATWKFVITSVPFNPTVVNKDGWAEYDTERQELLDFITANNIEGVVMISGDMHYGGGIDDGSSSGVPEINVPHTNMLATHANTTNQPGTWSEGILTGENNPGYSLIRVTPNAVILENKSSGGLVRQSFTLGEIPVRGFSHFQETSDGGEINLVASMAGESTQATSALNALVFLTDGGAVEPQLTPTVRHELTQADAGLKQASTDPSEPTWVSVPNIVYALGYSVSTVEAEQTAGEGDLGDFLIDWNQLRIRTDEV